MRSPALSEHMASWDQNDRSQSGIPSDRLVKLYQVWGEPGYCIILTGNTMLHPEQMEGPGNMVLYAPCETSERMEQFRKLASAAKAHGSLVLVQLSHPGRQVGSYLNSSPVSAGDVKLDDR